MKQLTLIAAAGSLAAISAPAQAADLPETSLPSLTENTLQITDFDAPFRLGGDDWDDDDDYRDRRRYRGDRYGRYDRHGRYREPRKIRRGDRVWRGRDGRYYCKRGNGTTGLIIGAAGGALLGRAIDTRGDRTVGTLLGGALGAVLGREIDRGSARCR
ncbi:glycine zipper 2TM domain-containing protein [uncultured Erythrobacter sp.]|uniref:glycine zipper 2TM domain-containing protein n=1 Tax=uncultured Erythrobacter sp. TaxID=263913 RepID=UPI0026274C51|nr:glycine zipper 2TM domain-containing protein [uncultured Erythrobacter sp.]